MTTVIETGGDTSPVSTDTPAVIESGDAVEIARINAEADVARAEIHADAEVAIAEANNATDAVEELEDELKWLDARLDTLDVRVSQALETLAVVQTTQAEILTLLSAMAERLPSIQTTPSAEQAPAATAPEVIVQPVSGAAAGQPVSPEAEAAKRRHNWL